MVRKKLILLSFLFTVLGFGCSEFQQAVNDAKKETPAPPTDNYIVLLDLSDRILYNNQQQVAKDMTIVNTIHSLFVSNIGSKDPTHLYYAVNDKLKVLIAPQKNSPRKIYDDAGQLRIELSSEEPMKKLEAVEQSEKTFHSLLPQLYKQAIVSNNNADYAGADIWKYFDEDLAGDLDHKAKNTLFIITDGYLDFEKTEDRPIREHRFTSCAQLINSLKQYPDWNTKFDEGDYGLMPIGKKFTDLKVVLLEINPKEDWNGEYKLLTRTWTKWFKEMGIDSCTFIKNDNINEVRESIEKFMQVKINGKIEPANWATMTITDSVKKKEPAEPIAAVTNPVKTTRKPNRISKQKEQVSFGPAY